MSSTFQLTSSPPRPKIHVTTGQLPAYISPAQLPNKKAPFSIITFTPFIKALTLTLPLELYTAISAFFPLDTGEASLLQHQQQSAASPTPILPPPPTAHLFLALNDILTPPFVTTFVQPPGSNIILISEGNPNVDDTYSLHTGIVRLNLSKSRYQSTGLQNGKAIKHYGGRMHVVQRYMVEIDLRQPSMRAGKKGFDRILWAAKNVLDERKAWLFCDAGPEQRREERKEILRRYQPTYVKQEAELGITEEVLVPEALTNGASVGTDALEEDYFETLEYLDLLMLGSPRVEAGDAGDPFISRYRIPGPPDSEPTMRTSIKTITWEGLISTDWVRRLMVEIMRLSRQARLDQWNKAKLWATMKAISHQTGREGEGDGWCMLLHSGATEDKVVQDEVERMDIDVLGQVHQAAEGEEASDRRRAGAGFQKYTSFQMFDTTSR